MKIRIFIENDTIYCIIDYSELPEEPLSLLPHAAREPTSIAAVSSIANFFFIKLSSSLFSYKSTMLCIVLY